MPNLPSLPSARSIAAGSQVRGDYGGYAEFANVDNAVSLKADGVTLVEINGDSDPVVDLANITTSTVPYVNAFLADHGVKVEKYWRTKAYRIVAGAAKVAAPVAQSTPFIPQPVVATTGEVIAFPAPQVDAFDPSAPIPGVDTPTPLKVKSSKGWTTLGQIVVPTRDYDTLKAAWDLRQAGVPSSVLVTGPAGTAKTALVRAFAASLGVDFLKVDGGAIRTADDWSGAMRQDPITRTWQHRWSPFARVLKRGTPMVVLCDEFNRTESPQALNALLGLIDWTGKLLVPDANDELLMPPGILLIATANIGPEFVGTLPLDGAVRQRFSHGIRLGYPDPEREVQLVVDMTGLEKDRAERLVNLADSQRANREDPQQYPSGAVISTRVVLDIARRIVQCETPDRDAVLSTLNAQFDPGDEAALSVLVDSQYPIMVEVEDDSVIEISDAEIAAQIAAESEAKADDENAQEDAALARVGQWKCREPRGQYGVTSPCGAINDLAAHECRRCSSPNPVVTALATAAAAQPRPLITVAKHFFVNRGLNGALTSECQFRFDKTTQDVCGKDRRNPIHHE